MRKSGEGLEPFIGSQGKMRWWNTIAILGILILGSSSYKERKSLRYVLALDYIKKDSLFLHVFKVQRSELIVDDRHIMFDLMTIADDIIKNEHLSSYHIFKELTKHEREIRQGVMDSLRMQEEIINKKENSECIELNKLKAKKRCTYLVSFSCIKERYLYAEVATYRKLDTQNVYGTTVCYLFLFKNDGMEKVYTGVVSRH